MNYNDRDDFKSKVSEKIKNDDKDHIYFAVPSEYTIKLTSYASMKNDLHFLTDATKKLIGIHQRYPTPEVNPDIIVEAALWYSIIVTYAKLYTEAFDKNSKLEEKDVFDILDEEKNISYKTHKELIRDRHNFVAHRADSELDNYIVFLKAPKSDPDNISFDVQTVRAYAKGTEYFVEYGKLFEKVFAVVDLKMNKQAEKLSKMISENPAILLKG
jgi:hypothetical protein